MTAFHVRLNAKAVPRYSTNVVVYIDRQLAGPYGSGEYSLHKAALEKIIC
jgi:hypothetical protein